MPLRWLPGRCLPRPDRVAGRRGSGFLEGLVDGLAADIEDLGHLILCQLDASTGPLTGDEQEDQPQGQSFTEVLADDEEELQGVQSEGIGVVLAAVHLQRRAPAAERQFPVRVLLREVVEVAYGGQRRVEGCQRIGRVELRRLPSRSGWAAPRLSG